MPNYTQHYARTLHQLMKLWSATQSSWGWSMSVNSSWKRSDKQWQRCASTKQWRGGDGKWQKGENVKWWRLGGMAINRISICVQRLRDHEGGTRVHHCRCHRAGKTGCSPPKNLDSLSPLIVPHPPNCSPSTSIVPHLLFGFPMWLISPSKLDQIT